MTDLEIAADELLDRLAAAIAARVRGRQTAEERLGAFAFHEEPSNGRTGDVAAVARSTASAAVPGSDQVDWRYFVVRALGVLADPELLRILEAIPSGGRPFDELVRLVDPSVPDRVAAADRVGRLAAAGLVGRDLESDCVSLLPLGDVLLELVADLARRTGSAGR